MNDRRKIALSVFLIFLFHHAFAAPAPAVETIVSYALFLEPGDQVSTAASTTAANTTSSDMIRGGGLLPNVGMDSFNSNGWATNAVGEPTDVNPDGYVEIGFDAALGFSVLLDELVIGSRSSGSGPSEIGILTSLDGFTDPVDVIDQTAGWPDPFGFVNSTFDISSLGPVSGAFRMRFMNVGGDNTADVLRPGEMDLESTWRIVDHLGDKGFSDTRITGTVVPEPSTLVAGALVLSLGFCGWRRRP